MVLAPLERILDELVLPVVPQLLAAGEWHAIAVDLTEHHTDYLVRLTVGERGDPEVITLYANVDAEVSWQSRRAAFASELETAIAMSRFAWGQQRHFKAK